jgi:hypothetical protein
MQVDKAVEEARASSMPWPEDLWTNIYKGTKPLIIHSCEHNEVRQVVLSHEGDLTPEQHADCHFTGSHLLIQQIKKAGSQQHCFFLSNYSTPICRLYGDNLYYTVCMALADYGVTECCTVHRHSYP